MSRLDHVSVGSNDVARAREFYRELFSILGLAIVEEEPGKFVDFSDGRINFSIETPVDGRRASPGNGAHFAFLVGTRAMVDRCFARALALGAQADGAPGRRPYSENYYAAFIRDLDGNKLEVLTRAPREKAEPQSD